MNIYSTHLIILIVLLEENECVINFALPRCSDSSTYLKCHFEIFRNVVEHGNGHGRGHQVVFPPEVSQRENDGVEPLEGDGQGDVDGSHSEGVHQTVVDPHAVGEQILPEPL